MRIDFTKYNDNEIKLLELADGCTIDDLRASTNEHIDFMLSMIEDATDADLVFIPHDPLADDAHAPEHERNAGWSLAHLVVHVTATAEEAAAMASQLARGIAYPMAPRLRYETDWHTVTTRDQVVQRLNESRRMRLAYLETWPDAPHLDVKRELSENALARFGEMNATANFLLGLSHEAGHFAQFREAARQAFDAAQGG